MTPSRYGFEFCSGDPFETRSAAAYLAAVHCGFAFYFAHPARFTRVIRGSKSRVTCSQPRDSGQACSIQKACDAAGRVSAQ
jgi:hypothetical protein